MVMRRNTLAPRRGLFATRRGAPHACWGSRTLSVIMSRRLVSMFGGIENCRRVKSVWEVGGCASSCCCRSGNVAVDAEVDEEPELPPSVVAESARSRDEEGVGNCASGFEVGAEEEVDSERFASCWLMPFCACET